MLVFPKLAGPSRGARIELELTEATTVDALVAELDAAHILAHPRLFAIYLRLLGADERLRVGQVSLRDEMTAAELSRRLATGLGATHARVTIPEGFNRFDVARRLAARGVADADAFLEATEDEALLEANGVAGPTAEGYLFPDTYELSSDTPPERIAAQMIRNFRRRVAALTARDAPALAGLERELGFDLHHVVILASVVEKEAAVDEERPIIAGVFLNRLRSPTFLPRKRLQADPTVSYGCLAEPDIAPSCEGFEGRISRAMLEDAANRYNTYRHGGLPPGPIANPGLASLRAVLEPAAHDYLYFVARGHGRHAFSASLAQHNRRVDRFIRGE
jgi:UPF0755 protein